MILLYYYFPALLLCFHPFHVSVCSVRYAAAEESLQITMKIFADDLEETLNEKPYRADRQPYVDVLNPKDTAMLNRIVEGYIAKHFEIMVNDKTAKPVYLGYEMEGMAMWCYLEVEDVKKVESIKVRNSILTESFDDQTNIVHVDYHNDIKSMKLAGNDLEGEVTFE